MTIISHRSAGDLGIAVSYGDRMFLMQTEQQMGPLVAEMVDEAIVKAAETRLCGTSA